MIARKVIMVRPSAFRFNIETAADNAYQINDATLSAEAVQEMAEAEFLSVVRALKSAGVQVDVLHDKGDDTPDSIFPNNIFVTFEGKLFIAPMYSENRQREFPKLKDQLDALLNFSSLEVTDFRDKNLGVLEGTGSVVLDRKENIAYACLSKRCEEAAFLAFCDTYGFAPLPFKARQHDADVYHTNVILSVAEDFAVVASELVTENKEALMERLRATKKTVIEVTGEQIDHFCGNCLELMGDEKLYLMSEEAYANFTKEQIAKIEATHKIVHVPMDVISTYGGGSMRCILAENYG
ncbi:arginine deiminase-related protein [Aedoeadaptatus acetigenes]|uniref:Arginine deiminase-related protein n=1 Tax=Aedoeadaptatus acetigenes TaxID=2981723 RepID=A0ABV1JA68_9FIRM|nr:amidinotransferase [Peptoniphilaceae bacterium]